jgi:GAF domain-containing protein
MTADRASDVSRPAAYILIVDTDADRIDAAVRGCGEALAVPTVVARNVDDAIRILLQFGSPAVLMVSLALPDHDGVSVIESLRRIDADVPVIAWAADRELREYAANVLAGTRAKVLSRAWSPTICRRCVDALLQPDVTSNASTIAAIADVGEDWLRLAESARQRLGVIGAAAYTKVCGAAEYRLSVSWMPDAPMLDFPIMLPSALEEVIASGVARIWTDLINESVRRTSSAAVQMTLRGLAVVPILRDGQTVGALCVFSSEPHAFRRDTLEILTAIAGRTTSRRSGPALAIDRDGADEIIKTELARARRDQLPLAVVLFAVTAPQDDLAAIGEILAAAVRGNDLVIRWTSSEVLLILAGVHRSVARRVAERIRGVVQTRAANRIAVLDAVTELRADDSVEDAIARAAGRLQNRKTIQASFDQSA